MAFIVIEVWPDLREAAIVVDPESGSNQVFQTREAAQTEADQCQNGKVVEILYSV